MFALTPFEIEALSLSLRVALCAAAGAAPIALALAWLLARREFWGKTALDGLVHLPIVLPPVVVGYLLLVGFGRRGPIGGALYDWFGIEIAFTWVGAALAAAVMGLPLMVRAMRLAFEAVDPGLADAARTLGANPMRAFATVTLPLAAPGVLAGLVLGFARALGEFGATITFVSNIPGETRTLPIALYTALQQPGGDEAAMRLALISVALCFAALAASEWLARRLRRVVWGRS